MASKETETGSENNLITFPSNTSHKSLYTKQLECAVSKHTCLTDVTLQSV